LTCGVQQRGAADHRRSESSGKKRGVGWYVLLGAELAFFLPATLLGLPGRGHSHPILPAARDLFVPAGFLLAVHGALAVMGRVAALAPPWPVTAREHRRTGLILYLVGIASVGFGTGEITGDRPWRALSVPAIVVIGLLSLREAVRGPARSRFFRLRPPSSSRPVWLIAAGLWMFGLSWPILAADALGLLD